MRILALETSGISGSVAFADGTQILQEICLPTELRSARALTPTIQQALRHAAWKPRDVEIVAVTSGPGSFTGLRVGVVTAKTFAYAVGCRVIGVDTLEVLAEQTAAPGDHLVTVLDAQRGVYFTASWSMSATREILPVEPARILSTEQLISLSRPGGKVVGPIVEKLAGDLPPEVEAIVAVPKAAAVAAVAYRMAIRGETANPFELVPHYLRRTAAEEQWEKRQAKTS